MEKPDPADGERESTPDSDFASVVKTKSDKRKRAADSKADQSDHKKSYRRSWRSASPLTKLMIYFTALAAISTLIYAFFAGWQWYEIHSGAEETRRLAQAARDSADAAQRQASIAVEQLQALKDATQAAKDSASAANAAVKQNNEMIKSARLQADTSQVSARAAERSARFAEQTVRATKDATFTASRAYVSVRQIYAPELNRNGTSIIKLDWDNDGNSPAYMTGGKVALMVTSKAPSLRECLANITGPVMSVVVQPRSTRTQRFSFPQGTFPIDKMTAIENGSGVMTLCGEFFYETLGQTFSVQFCGFWDKEAKTYINCEGSEAKQETPN